jgi:GTP cyclohydrolase II
MLEKQGNITTSADNVERAIDELRRQQGVWIHESGGRSIANIPVEFLDDTLFSALRAPGQHLLITAARARMLHLADTDTRIDATSLTLPQLMALADPTTPQSLPAHIAATPASAIDSMALKLAKFASLLPALLLSESPLSHTTHWLSLDSSELQAYIEHPHIDVIQTASAALPLAQAENTRIISFRTRHATSVHLALIIGTPDSGASPLTRIHSSCVTGDILGSLRCDCGDQLHLAIEQICAAGSGILIYLHQEGRGIGITNKLRAYALQEQGMDTFEANLALGFDEDERNFAIAAAILRKLGVPAIRMLTNNPHKLSALQAAGVIVTERVPLMVQTGRHNHAYLQAKIHKSGHLL